jgi:hypothetical protein
MEGGDRALGHVPAVVPGDAVEVGRGVWQWDLSAGARVMAVGVQADPLKDSEVWWARQQETMPPYEFLREYGLDFGVWAGKAVFPEYQDRYHAARGPLGYVGNRPVVRGWDVPGPIGVVWVQRVPMRALGPTSGQGVQDGLMRVQVIGEFLADTAVGTAGRAVQGATAEWFPGATEVVDVADPAAFDRRANEAQSCADILRRECGIHLRPGPRTLTDRHEPMRRALMGLVPNASPSEPPGVVLVDPSCARVKEGLRSAYHYKLLPGAQGRYHDVPEKNWASHLLDALCYAVAWMSMGMGEEPGRGAKPEPLDFSRAVGGYRSVREAWVGVRHRGGRRW